jgi:hypothetical protein
VNGATADPTALPSSINIPTIKSLALLVETVMDGEVVPDLTAGMAALMSNGASVFAPETPNTIIKQSEALGLQVKDTVPENVDVVVAYHD